jgi:hypothetical protein
MTEHPTADMLEEAALLETARATAMSSGDTEGFGAMLSPDVSFIHANGALDSRDSLLTKLRDGVIVYRRVAAVVEAVKALGPNVVMARGTLMLDARVAGIEKKMRSIYVVIWVRGGDGWRLVHHQTTSLPPVPEAADVTASRVERRHGQ